MAIYPEIKPDWGYSLTPEFKTDLLGPTDGDFTQRRRRRSAPLYKAELSYSARLTYEQRMILLKFFRDHHGAWQSFTFYDFTPSKIEEHQVGVGDDTTTAWVIEKYRDVEHPIVRFDGVSTIDFSLQERTGPDGQDTLTFPVPPAAGVIITLEGDGKLRVPNCIFNTDSLSAPLAKWRRYEIGPISIIQVN